MMGESTGKIALGGGTLSDFAARALADFALSEEHRRAVGERLPWAPAHLRGSRDAAGDLTKTWVRGARRHGEWLDGADVPLVEESESYDVEILNIGGTVLRTFAGTNGYSRQPFFDQHATCAFCSDHESGQGGSGGIPGGGAGGGGAATNGASSGAGGIGGRGEVWFLRWRRRLSVVPVY